MRYRMEKLTRLWGPAQ